MTRNTMRWSAAALAVAVSGLLLAADPITPATVAKPSITAHAKPDFASPSVATFSKNAAVKVSGQQGLSLCHGCGGLKARDRRVQLLNCCFLGGYRLLRGGNVGQTWVVIGSRRA